ncbi:MAG: hypothetical protein OXF86_07420 [Caldilineaceae bacterium]|nr:hypothetical protein [Caldilineaceae bacterium]
MGEEKHVCGDIGIVFKEIVESNLVNVARYQETWNISSPNSQNC